MTFILFDIYLYLSLLCSIFYLLYDLHCFWENNASILPVIPIVLSHPSFNSLKEGEFLHSIEFLLITNGGEDSWYSRYRYCSYDCVDGCKCAKDYLYITYNI